MADATPTPVYHPSYNDPSDRIILVSNGGLRFRASGWKLAQNCEGFKHREHDSDHQTYPIIKLDASSDVVDLFLSLIYAPRSILPPTTPDNLTSLFKLCQRYSCSTISSVRKQLGTTIKHPWDLLTTASDLEDVDLAKTAIKRFSSDKLLEAPNLGGAQGFFWTQLRRLQPTWQLSFIYAVFGGEVAGAGVFGVGKGGLRLEARGDWTANAEDFDPPELKHVTRPGRLIAPIPTASFSSSKPTSPSLPANVDPAYAKFTSDTSSIKIENGQKSLPSTLNAFGLNPKSTRKLDENPAFSTED